MKRLLARLELIEATGVLGVDVDWVNGNYQRILFHSVRTASADRVRRMAAPRRHLALVCFLHQAWPSTAGSPPSEPARHRTPFAVRSWRLDEHRELPVGRRRRQSADGADTPAMKSSFAITASSRSSSSAIFSPTRRHRPAPPRRW